MIPSYHPGKNMTTQIRTLSPLDRAVPTTFGTRIGQAIRAAGREIVETIQAPAELRNELRRMADACEITSPEKAARLRKLAKSNWSD